MGYSMVSCCIKAFGESGSPGCQRISVRPQFAAKLGINAFVKNVTVRTTARTSHNKRLC
jgi:hypothetical protein